MNNIIKIKNKKIFFHAVHMLPGYGIEPACNKMEKGSWVVIRLG